MAPCFTHERFHKLAKSYASTRRNTTSYERGIIEDIAASQICSNEEATFGYMGLKNPVAPTASLLLRFRASPLIAKDAVIAVARVYTTGLCRIAKGDVVFWKAASSTKVGAVHLHLSVHGACKTVVSPFTEGSRDGRLMHCTERKGEFVIIDSSDLIRSAIYARTANAVDVILKPDEVSR